MMLNPHDDPRTASEFSSADLEAECLAQAELSLMYAQRALRELQALVVNSPEAVAHYKATIADIANDFLAVASGQRVVS